MKVRSAVFFAAAAHPRQLPPPRLPEIGLAGRSNVGKSSLLNRLIGRRALARVSRRPGRTQQINFFLIDGRWLLADLPGYGFARVPSRLREQWRQVIEAYLDCRPTLCGVVVIVDVRRGVEPDDALLIDFLTRRQVAVQLAATKIDKLGRGERVSRLRLLSEAHPELHPIGCSAVSGEGIAELARAVTRWLDRSRDKSRGRSEKRERRVLDPKARPLEPSNP